jgi:SH3-like domain-containing protein
MTTHRLSFLWILICIFSSCRQNETATPCPELAAIVDSLRVLPDEEVGVCRYALANVSAADLRTEPNYEAEMSTQLLLGAPMQVLQTRGGWLRVKTPEGYVAWIQEGTIVRMTRESLAAWNRARKIIMVDDYGWAYEEADERGARVSDVVFGNVLKWEGESVRFYRVSFPDGRSAWVLKSQGRLLEEWKSSIRLTGASIAREAIRLRGIPYSWGGTSVKALDCSGFTKTVYLKHGILLRRDASQQAQTGIPIDIAAGYGALLPGDLLFFGKKADGPLPERVRHVGLYLGNGEFIHAAGFVRISSLDPNRAHYDQRNAPEWIRAVRILGASGEEGIGTIDDSFLYQIK